jgi:hypothetical protein
VEIAKSLLDIKRLLLKGIIQGSLLRPLIRIIDTLLIAIKAIG